MQPPISVADVPVTARGLGLGLGLGLCVCMYARGWMEHVFLGEYCVGGALCCDGSVALGAQESCSCLRTGSWALSATEETCTHRNIFFLLIARPGNTVEISQSSSHPKLLSVLTQSGSCEHPAQRLGESRNPHAPKREGQKVFSFGAASPRHSGWLMA